MLSLDQQNRLRERYRLENNGWQPATERFAAAVRASLTPESRLLDLGCGRGGLVEQLDHPLRQVIGLDPDFPSLREHRLDLPRCQGFSDRLPFATRSFDLIFATWLLEHLARPAADLAEIGRVLRPGGRFVFITPNKDHPIALLNRSLGRFNRLQGTLVQRLYGRQPDDTFATWYRANREADLRKMGTVAGLQLETLAYIHDPTYLAFHPALFKPLARLNKFVPQKRAIHLVGSMRKKVNDER